MGRLGRRALFWAVTQKLDSRFRGNDRLGKRHKEKVELSSSQTLGQRLGLRRQGMAVGYQPFQSHQPQAFRGCFGPEFAHAPSLSTLRLT
jgi:hypothetical protein